MLNISSFIVALALPFGERVEYALKVSVVGILAVFGALTLIMLIIKLFKVILDGIETLKKRKNAKQIKAASEYDRLPLGDVHTADDGELIAVITAAIAATIASDASNAGAGERVFGQGGFRVVSFKRTGKRK